LKTETEIINLSDEKLRVAEFLLQNNFFDDAYYLGGYSFELCLKAKICKTLDIPDFFDFDNIKNRRLPVSRNKSKDSLYKSFKVHDYEQLLILSGLYTVFAEKISTDLEFEADWSIVSKWDESLRYSTGVNEMDVKSFIQSIKNIITWLKQYL
jgi:HEPN domain-containing protein